MHMDPIVLSRTQRGIIQNSLTGKYNTTNADNGNMIRSMCTFVHSTSRPFYQLIAAYPATVQHTTQHTFQHIDHCTVTSLIAHSSKYGSGVDASLCSGYSPGPRIHLVAANESDPNLDSAESRCTIRA